MIIALKQCMADNSDVKLHDMFPKMENKIQMSLPDGFDCYQSTPSVSSSPANP